jgi:hypothetical protein
MRPTIKTRVSVWASLPFLVALLAVAAPAAQAGWNPYWFSWSGSNCTGSTIDPVSTYFNGPAAKAGRVRDSLINHLIPTHSGWGTHQNESQGQYFRHYTTGGCVQSTISIANGGGNEARMHIRGAQDASGPNFETGLTPHYELHISICGGHVIAFPGAPSNYGGRVRNGGYVYPRIKIQQAYYNGNSRAFPFKFGKRDDSRSRRQCTWKVYDGGTLVHISYGR